MPGVLALAVVAILWDLFALRTRRETISGWIRRHPKTFIGFVAWFLPHLWRRKP